MSVLRRGIAGVLMILLLGSMGCKRQSGDKTPEHSTAEPTQTPSAPAPRLKFGICFTETGPQDRSFNSMQYNGSVNVQAHYNVEFVYRTPETNKYEDFFTAIEALAKDEQCDMVITSGFEVRKPLTQAAETYPATQFVLLDVVAHPAENVASVIFAQHEGSFVVGALAAKVTKTKKIGFIGGVDVDVIKSFLQGFKEGITYIDPSIELLVEYCSLTPDFSGFGAPDTGSRIASRMYADGVDIIYAVAGGSGTGVIQAAKEQQKYVIGVDSNQDYMAPGFVLTSMMKRLDVAVFDICEKYISGEHLGNTTYEYSYKNGGVSITPMEFTRKKIPAGVLDEIHQIERQIAEDNIVVTNIMTHAATE